jgi:hypothetical protein
MKSKSFVNVVAIVLLIIVALIGLARNDVATAGNDHPDKIEGMLLDRFTVDGTADFIVRFTEQADLSAAYSMDWNARGEFVYNTLLNTATRSQANAKALLDGRGITYQTFVAGNDLYVKGGTLAIANELTGLSEVDSIRATQTYYVEPMTDVKPFQNIAWAGDFLANRVLTTVANSTDATTDWGITDTKANQVWSLGVRGSGIKVASIDTGVQWNHPALVNQFACPNDPSNPNCWYDPSNICGGSACDNYGHGTHTMGTMVGKDNPSLSYIVGMAPDATWIACKGCESGSCSDFALLACADWILAPNGNPANRPNVVNNSWGGFPGGDNWYQAKVQAWVAAGIFPAFSAGNSGSGCNTLGDPGDYQESFASAAHDSTRTIASFSSRGPSAFGNAPYTKPNISAPGVSICSSVPTNKWDCTYSGTSMASPHTAGAVALLWSCDPGLIGNIDATFQALQNSTDVAPAGNCGAGPNGGNYTYGYGYLNALTLINNNCATHLPGAFNKTSPANRATNVSTNPTLTWGASNGATSYEYCYDTTNDNACSGWTSNGNNTSVALNGLSMKTSYYWQVRAVNSAGSTYANGSATVFWKFTTGYIPGSFSKTAPANRSTNVSTNPTLSWGASARATSYEYCYDTTNDNACTNWTNNGTSTSVALSGLNPNTPYYWHVRAINAFGTTYANGRSTAFWRFTTGNVLRGIN